MLVMNEIYLNSETALMQTPKEDNRGVHTIEVSEGFHLIIIKTVCPISTLEN